MGRPTAYNEEIQEKADKYIDGNYGKGIPSVAGLALYLGVCRATIKTWAKHSDKPDFLATLDSISCIQESRALEYGLIGDFNSAITKLVLSNHGYRERQEVATIVTTEELTEEQLDARIEAFKNGVE